MLNQHTTRQCTSKLNVKNKREAEIERMPPYIYAWHIHKVLESLRTHAILPLWLLYHMLITVSH